MFKMLTMNLPLKGIIPPIITPLLENGTLDSHGLLKLLNHVIEGGVHGVFLLGTTGEAPSLTYSLRKQLVKEACSIINKRIPILVGITDTSVLESIEMANFAKEAGADALVIAPPYYFPISQIEMQEYLECLVPQLPLPFLLYNMPSCTKLHLSLETVKKARELGAMGIKDSSGNQSYFYDLLNEFKNDPEFSIISGTELFLSESILNGGYGCVAGGANFFPKLFVELYEASLVRDFERIPILREKVIRIYNTIYAVGQYNSRFIKGAKSALSTMGICKDYMAQPLKRFNHSERIKISEYVHELSPDILNAQPE